MDSVDYTIACMRRGVRWQDIVKILKIDVPMLRQIMLQIPGRLLEATQPGYKHPLTKEERLV